MSLTADHHEKKTVECRYHDWESGSWGVIIGVSKCEKCGRVCRTSDFPSAGAFASKPEKETK